MSCERWNEVVVELGRGGRLLESERAEAVAHVDACERCKRLLEEEQSLSSALREVAKLDAADEAVPEMDPALLAAFRGEQRGRVAAYWTAAFDAVRFRPNHSASPDSTRRRRSIWVGGLAAAAAATLLALAINGGGVVLEVEDDSQSGVWVEGQNPELESGGDEALAQLHAVDDDEEDDDEDDDEDSKDDDEGVPGRRWPSPIASSSTRFIPLSPAAFARDASLAAAAIVRVTVPRSYLHMLGFPINPDRTEPVEADVLLGEDGLAHAIRFVRNTPGEFADLEDLEDDDR